MSKLNPDRIIDEAMAIIEADGEAALAMRPLASRFGVTPMALYRYFPDRDALLIAIVARVSERIEFPDPVGTPAGRAVDLALCLHDFLVTHPWMIRLISTGRLASPAGLSFPEGFLTCARDAGLDDEASFIFYRTMLAAILGQAAITHAKREQGSGSLPEHAMVAPPPTVAAFVPRWKELDETADPRRVFQALASLLPTR